MDVEEDEVEVTNTRVANKKPRRSWRKHEEDALLKCMVNEHGDKWKADNGFRPGFFTLLEKELDKVVPESKIKASPHIESKVKYWRIIYNRILDITSLSGLGWDYTNKRIVVDDENVWKEYEKAYPKKAKGMNGKTFSYYNEWCILFGKDRATGVGAEAPTDMTMPDITEPSIIYDDYYTPFFGEEFGGVGVGSPSSQIPTPPTPTTHTSTTPTPTSRTSTTSTPTPHTSTAPTTTLPSSIPHSSLPTSTPRSSAAPANAGTKKGRKRTRMGEDEESMFASMETFLKESSNHMGEISKAMGYEKDLSALRKGVPKELENLDLIVAQQFKLAAIICAAEERIDNFYGQKPERKQAWVEAVLAGDVYPL